MSENEGDTAACRDTPSRDTPNRDSMEQDLGLDNGKSTPSNLPEYSYDRATLNELSLTPAAKRRPACLGKDYDTPEGVWDPEKWFRSFDNSRNNSPAFNGSKDRKRVIELQRDFFSRRRPSDPKEYIKDQEQDGIVLSPQRRSFGTGCQVTKQIPSLRRPTSPGDSRDLDRNQGNARRIGSGRIQVDRERDRDFRGSRYDNRDERREDSRDHRFERYHRNSESERDDSRFQRNRDYDEGRRYNNRDRRSYGRQEEEPEWFSAGPISQKDTIELRGFKETSDSEERTSMEGDSEAHEVKNVSDRNGSIETNDSSSPEMCPRNVEIQPQERDPTPERELPGGPDHGVQTTDGGKPPETGLDFDFDQFLIGTFPQLAVSGPPLPTYYTENQSPVPQDPQNSGSRFSRWFQGTGSKSNSRGNSRSNSQNNSRRSSFNEGDFNYLNDLIGQRSPVIPSPTPDHRHTGFSPIMLPEEQQQRNFLEMLNNSKVNIQPLLNLSHQAQNGPQQALSAANMEAHLKALLMSGLHNRGQQQQHAPPIGVPMKARTLDEIEGSSPAPPLGKFKTVAELEADMSGHKRPSEPPIQQPQQDMSAFNKLLVLMQASGTLSDTSPKMPVHQGAHAASPVEMQHVQPQQNHAKPPHSQTEIIQELFRRQEQQRIQQDLIQKLQHQKQQQQQQQHQLLNIIKPTPRIVTKPASPIPPQMLQQQQQTITPRVNSPVPSSLLQAQASTPRGAPSPIMFSTQPPPLLTAPSPIHASQSPQGLGSPQCRSPVPRVPSPQELIAHTQAIMQNALIKKQLEDQKERFLKKQHDTGRAKSPNPINLRSPTSIAPIFNFPTTSQPAATHKAPMNTFLPTSVIRKMATDKMDEKDKAAKLNDSTANPPGSPQQKDGAAMTTNEKQLQLLQNILMNSPQHRPITNAHSSPKHTPPHSLPPQHVQNTPTMVVSSPNEADPVTPRALTGQKNYPVQVDVVSSSEQSPAGRPIIKGASETPPNPQRTNSSGSLTTPGSVNMTPGSVNMTPGSVNMTSGSVNMTPVSASTPGSVTTPGSVMTPGTMTTPGTMATQGSATVPSTNNPAVNIDLQKLLHDQQQRLQQQNARTAGQQQMQQGRVPVRGVPGFQQAGVVRPGTNAVTNAAAANALLMQRLMSPGNMSQGQLAQLNQLNQLNQMAVLQAQQQQQQQQQRGVIDPRLQAAASARAATFQQSPQVMNSQRSPNMLNVNMAAAAVLGRSLSPLPPGATSPGLPPRSPLPWMQQSTSPLPFANNNFSKWFGNDVLKQQLPTMPPLPAAGKKVMTLDEIERQQQQMVTH